MNRILTIAGMLASGFAAGRFLTLDHLAGSLSSLVTVIPIMIAAVLVRLNRGMPSIEWKSVTPAKRRQLTAAVEHVARDYVHIMATLTINLTIVLILNSYGIQRLTSIQNEYVNTFLPAVISALIFLSFWQMCYVVWRDYDIVRLQRAIVDEASNKEEEEEQKKVADAKLAEIKSANLAPGTVAPPKSWSSD